MHGQRLVASESGVGLLQAGVPRRRSAGVGELLGKGGFTVGQ
ncbi:MAG TPA: hypothetical protein PKD84_13125 [Propionicimonas sp.]|nr:hypothetical protein [Propionicimonas sp.]